MSLRDPQDSAFGAGAARRQDQEEELEEEVGRRDVAETGEDAPAAPRAGSKAEPGPGEPGGESRGAADAS